MVSVLGHVSLTPAQCPHYAEDSAAMTKEEVWMYLLLHMSCVGVHVNSSCSTGMGIGLLDVALYVLAAEPWRGCCHCSFCEQQSENPI